MNNQLQSADNANREEKLFIGQANTVSGSSYYPIYIYDSHTGKMDNRPQAYLGLNGSSVIGKENTSSNKLGIALPESISIGTEWVVNPFDPADKHQKMKCLEHLNSFTNKSGNSYSDVIKLSVELKDSVYYKDSDYYEYAKLRKASAVVYLAKNKGLIEASGNIYEGQAEKYSGSLYGYKKSGTYTLSRKDK